MRPIPVISTAALFLILPALVGAQLRSQSDLTAADADPAFRLTLDHLGGGNRVFGLAPRDFRWSPDGMEVYFRWRDDPMPDQLADDDPWFAVDREGRTLRELTEDEIHRVPSTNAVRTVSGETAAWSSQGSLYVWTADGGTRPVYAVAGQIGQLRLSPDGTKVLFATKGLSPNAAENGDLWEHDIASGATRQIAVVVPAKEEETDQQTWLKAQQSELVQVVRERKERDERRDQLRRDHNDLLPQEIPVPKGEKAVDIRLSPDGKYLVFRSRKDPSEPKRTSFMEFVNESGQATEKDARPKVGEALPSSRLGIVAVDQTVRTEDIEIRWVEDGIEKDTVMHGPWWSPDGKQAAVQMLSMDHKERWLALLDIEAGTLRHLDHQQEEAWVGGPLVVGRWSPGYLEWLPDSQAFAFGSTASGWAMLLLANLEGEVTALTEGEFEVRRAELAPGGDSFLVTTSQEHPGEEHLYRLPARGGALEQITGGEAMHSLVGFPGREPGRRGQSVAH